MKTKANQRLVYSGSNQQHCTDVFTKSTGSRTKRKKGGVRGLVSCSATADLFEISADAVWISLLGYNSAEVGEKSEEAKGDGCISFANIRR